LLEAKDKTIRILEEQLRLRAEEIQRRDMIISQLTQANAILAQRVPELEPAATAETPPDAPCPPLRPGVQQAPEGRREP
jgi:hypothetical protein